VVRSTRPAADSSASAQSASGCPSADAWPCGLPDPLEEQEQAPPALQDHLPAKQIKGLNAVCAFVNRIEPVVTVKLFHVVVAGVAVSTVDLDSQTVCLDAPL